MCDVIVVVVLHRREVELKGGASLREVGQGLASVQAERSDGGLQVEEEEPHMEDNCWRRIAMKTILQQIE